MDKFTITINSQLRETDLVGHINNVSISPWFEDLRVRYMESLRGLDVKGDPSHFTLFFVTIDFVGETHYRSDVVMTL